MRGKEGKNEIARTLLRITPAYAGKSATMCLARFLLRDHPRICGEKYACPPKIEEMLGITPAYAGKSARCAQKGGNIRDHPRICGEKNPPAWKTPTFIGSPPHMRGKAGESLRSMNAVGITPAYAGKSCSILNRFARFGDHPRICGEKGKFSKLHDG